MSIDLAKNFELPKKSNFATAGALVLVAALLAGCSSIPNWANPVEWYEGATDAIFGDKESESMPSGDARRPKYTSGEKRDFPKLASVPERPEAPTTGERKRLAERLTSDRENAKYSQETIRRQSEAAVSTPPPPPAEAATASGQPLPAPFTTVRPVAPLAPAQTASTPPSSMRPLVVPPVSGVSRLGPTPSSRTPEFAPRPPTPRATIPSGAAVRSLATRPSPSRRSVARLGNPTFGEPPADISAYLGTGTPAAGAQGFAQQPLAPIAGTASAQSPPVGAPVGVVRFKAGSASLSSRERRGLRRIAQAYRKRGGAIRVEGHASSRTRNMDLVQHRTVNFNVSLDRANSVARELFRLGVPEQAVFVAALSDSRPLYYEIMPSGDAGNQRVEVYFLN